MLVSFSASRSGSFARQGLVGQALESDELPAAVLAAEHGADRLFPRRVGPNRGRGVVPPDQLVVHPLEQGCHRQYLL